MTLRYSQFHGLPVIASDGAVLGRVANLIVQKRGDDAVGRTLIIAPNRLLVFALRLGLAVNALAVDANDIGIIDEWAVSLKFAKARYSCTI